MQDTEQFGNYSWFTMSLCLYVRETITPVDSCFVGIEIGFQWFSELSSSTGDYLKMDLPKGADSSLHYTLVIINPSDGLLVETGERAFSLVAPPALELPPIRCPSDTPPATLQPNCAGLKCSFHDCRLMLLLIVLQLWFYNCIGFMHEISFI